MWWCLVLNRVAKETILVLKKQGLMASAAPLYPHTLSYPQLSLSLSLIQPMKILIVLHLIAVKLSHKKNTNKQTNEKKKTNRNYL